MGDGALDDGPGHDATLWPMVDFPRGLGGGVLAVEEVVDVIRSGDPLAVLEDVRLERHGEWGGRVVRAVKMPSTGDRWGEKKERAERVSCFFYLPV